MFAMPLASRSSTTQAQILLREWERHAAPPILPAYRTGRPALLAQLTELCASLHSDSGVTIDCEDLRTVLRSAAHFRVGTAAVTGSNRAIRAARALLAAIQTPPVTCGPAQRALLSIVSPAAQPLHMDELTLITETIQHTLGQDAELIFGHDETEDSSVTELRVWLLVGYGSPT